MPSELRNETRKRTAEVEKSRKLLDSKPKRPMNPFLLFCQVEKKRISDENLKLSFEDFNNELSNNWKNLKTSEKKVYEEKFHTMIVAYKKDLAKWEMKNGIDKTKISKKRMSRERKSSRSSSKPKKSKDNKKNKKDKSQSRGRNKSADDKASRKVEKSKKNSRNSSKDRKQSSDRKSKERTGKSADKKNGKKDNVKNKKK